MIIFLLMLHTATGHIYNHSGNTLDPICTVFTVKSTPVRLIKFFLKIKIILFCNIIIGMYDEKVEFRNITLHVTIILL